MSHPCMINWSPTVTGLRVLYGNGCRFIGSSGTADASFSAAR